MVSLKDVKSDVVLDYWLGEKEKDLIINAGSVYDVEIIINNYPQYNWINIKKRIDRLKRTLDDLNKEGYIKEVYSTKGISDKRYGYVDRLNKGNILLLSNISGMSHCKFREIRDLTIDEIKVLMTYIDGYGNNYLKCILHGVGDIHIKKLIKGIELYEEQVDRQIKDDNGEDNIFKINKDKKFALAYINVNKIIRFIVEQDKLVWGDLTDSMRDRYIHSIKSDSIRSKKIKNELSDVISNYTTFDELVDLNDGNIKVLNRFVIR